MGLMIFLGDRVDFRFYNSALLPGLLPALLVGIEGSPGKETTYHRLREPPPDHSIFEAIASAEGLRSPRFYAYIRIRLGERQSPSFFSATATPPLPKPVWAPVE